MYISGAPSLLFVLSGPPGGEFYRQGGTVRGPGQAGTCRGSSSFCAGAPLRFR